MLGMFGFLKKELKDTGDLLLKYQGYVGQLYNWKTNKPINDEQISAFKNILEFTPYESSKEFDFANKSWHVICKGSASKLTSSYSDLIDMFICTSNNGTITSTCGPKFAAGKLYNMYKDYGASSSNNGTQHTITQAQASKGFWLKLEHNNGTLISSYSLNKTNWVNLGTKFWNGFGKEKNYILIETLNTNASNDIHIETSEIEFVYDNEIIFRKI